MEQRIVLPSERQYSSSVNDIEHIESNSEYGQAIIKVYFQPNANIGIGVGELATVSEALSRYLAPGISPPFIYRFNATDVPIIQLAVTSPTVSEDQLNDYATNFIRIPLSTIQGTTVTPAVGGKPRNVMVDIDL